MSDVNSKCRHGSDCRSILPRLGAIWHQPAATRSWCTRLPHAATPSSNDRRGPGRRGRAVRGIQVPRRRRRVDQPRRDRSGLRDYATVLARLAGYSALGMAVAVLLRSVPLALAVGIAWAGPVEHLIGDAWASGRRSSPACFSRSWAEEAPRRPRRPARWSPPSGWPCAVWTVRSGVGADPRRGLPGCVWGGPPCGLALPGVPSGSGAVTRSGCGSVRRRRGRVSRRGCRRPIR